eukprot:scaffold99418_cov15-Tisochrysis_lutea.AAC.1
MGGGTVWVPGGSVVRCLFLLHAWHAAGRAACEGLLMGCTQGWVICKFGSIAIAAILGREGLWWDGLRGGVLTTQPPPLTPQGHES